MKSAKCENCDRLYQVGAGSKGRFCSITCANEFHRVESRANGAALKNNNIIKYLKDPKLCKQCNNIIDYDKRGNEFCNGSCAATFNNIGRVRKNKIRIEGLKVKQPKIKKSKSFICPITGEIITDKNEYLQREWRYLPSGRIKTIRLLSSTFNISLMNLEAPTKLSEAKEKLRYAYEVDMLSSSQIKEIFNIRCTTGHISNLLKTLGIARRTFSESTSLAFSTGRSTLPISTQYKTGFHIDFLGNSHFYRSSYELDYYLILDNLQTSYETETIRIKYFDTFANKDRIAVPDIILNDRTIVEIKSNYTYNRQNMIDKFIEYQKNGYSFVLCLDKIEYHITDITQFP